MKVGELIKHLKELDPELMVVYSVDDEGNSFHPVHFAPSEGHYNNGQWYTENDVEEGEWYDPEGFKINAVCVN